MMHIFNTHTRVDRMIYVGRPIESPQVVVHRVVVCLPRRFITLRRRELNHWNIYVTHSIEHIIHMYTINSFAAPQRQKAAGVRD